METKAQAGRVKGYALIQDAEGNLKFDKREQIDMVPDDLKEFVQQKLAAGQVRVMEEEVA